MRLIALTFFSLVSLFFVVGCQAPAAATGPTAMVLEIPDRDNFYDDTLTLLRERDFPLERVDRDAGLIVSQPSIGQQWFEFWRSDSIGGYQLFESSIHSIRRIVTVSVEPEEATTDAGGQYRVTVQVDKERYSAPERQVTTASGALVIYSEHLPTTEGVLASKVRGEHWIPLGRDALFEKYLLEKIATTQAGSVEP